MGRRRKQHLQILTFVTPTWEADAEALDTDASTLQHLSIDDVRGMFRDSDLCTTEEEDDDNVDDLGQHCARLSWPERFTPLAV